MNGKKAKMLRKITHQIIPEGAPDTRSKRLHNTRYAGTSIQEFWPIQSFRGYYQAIKANYQAAHAG